MEAETRNLRRRVDRLRAKHGFAVSCPASRHLQMIAGALAKGKHYPMLAEEPEYCAGTMLMVIEALWKSRAASIKGRQTA